MAIAFYKVFITPLKSVTTYGSEIDVTDFVIAGGVGKVAQSIDSGSYDIGLYTYADLTINLINYTGLFNDDSDSASMFYYTRDRAKVRVEYIDEDVTTNIVFNGIINDEATQQDFEKATIKIRVLSRDSIFRKTKVSGGLISDGNTATNAIKALLNRPAITAVIGYNASKITVGYDAIIDSAVPFSESDTRTVLESLLNASGSVFYIDTANEMVVSTRAITAVGDIALGLEDGSGDILLEDGTGLILEVGAVGLSLYGGGDPLQKDNIITIKNYNTGLQRAFNTITTNEQTATDEEFVTRYGVFIKNYTFKFITTAATSLALSEYILNQFKTPKNELEVTVKTELAKNAAILDSVTVSFALRYKGFDAKKVPLAGSSIAGSDYSPYIIGGIKINGNKDWKIIGITHDTKAFLTTLRLREV